MNPRLLKLLEALDQMICSRPGVERYDITGQIELWQQAYSAERENLINKLEKLMDNDFATSGDLADVRYDIQNLRRRTED
jgi:hypothetical protein